MVLENVKEMWTETPRTAGGKKGRPVNKDRFISKMYAHTISFLDAGLASKMSISTNRFVQVLEGRFRNSRATELMLHQISNTLALQYSICTDILAQPKYWSTSLAPVL